MTEPRTPLAVDHAIQHAVDHKVRLMESRARSLRAMAANMPETAGDAFRRRAAAIELMAFATRNLYVPTNLPDDSSVRINQQRATPAHVPVSPIRTITNAVA